MTDAYIGEIRLFGSIYAPKNWLPCDGYIYPISEFDALYATIGTAYGGDGHTTFAVPDMGARVPLHMGQGPGLTGRRLGERGGHDEITLTEENLPAHNHALQASRSGERSVEPKGRTLTVIPSDQRFYKEVEPPLVALSEDAVASEGSVVAHPNVMPYLVLNYIICHHGYFPSRV